MIQKQLNRLAAVRLATRSTPRPPVCRWSVFLATATTVLGQNSDLSVPPFSNPILPSTYPGTGPGDIEAPSNAAQFAAPGADNGVLHDVGLTRDLPYIAPVGQPHREYNVKLGQTTMLLTGGVGMSYSDNALQGASNTTQDDITITPSLGISLNLPINRDHAFRIDVGVGYRYSLNYSQLNSLYLAPSSYIDYRVRVGSVVITLFDQLSSSGDTLQRVDLRNQGTAAGVNFNRIDNRIGVSAAYELSRETSLVGGYSFGFNRGLSDTYNSFDSNTHSLTAALYHRLHPRLTVGLSSSYNINEFQQGVYSLNNSSGWSVGPVVSYRPTDSINISVAVRYSSITYDGLSNLQVASNPSSITFDFNAAHRLNRYLSHQLTASRAYNSSVSSAQMEVLSAGYALQWRALRHTTLSAHINWQNYQQNANTLGSRFPNAASFIDQYVGQPGPNGSPLTAADLANYYNLFAYQDSGDAIFAGLSSSYQISSKLAVSLAYGYNLRESSVSSALRPSGFNNYQGNTITLNFGYRF